MLDKIMAQFDVSAKIENYGNGHINDTYISRPNDYILQRINTAVFKNPQELMDNIEAVTGFLKKKIEAEGGDPMRETLTVIKTKDGKSYYECDGMAFRMYKYVDHTVTIEEAKTSLDMYKAGKGFGHFGALLNDFPADTLNVTIADFHNTPKRLENLKKAVAEDKMGRAAYARKEIEFCLAREDVMQKVTEGIKTGEIPLRVTHNDTKINNILFDVKTGDGLCVIDLDTVMPGSILYDFGDALRIGASTASEDETDLSKVLFDVDKFESFAKGYLEETADFLTEKETEFLAFSSKLLTLECGMRFLTDYLEGDTYFKIHRENHNLERARNQFKLVTEIEEKEEKLNLIIKHLLWRGKI